MWIGLAAALVLAAHPLGAVDVAADGGRYVAVQPRAGGPVRVHDERTGRRFTIADGVDGCDEPVVGGRWLLLRCDAVHPHPRVWTLRHPARPPVDLAAPPASGALPYFTFTGIGRRWVSVRIDEDHGVVRRGLLERATGRFVADTGRRRRSVPDLDARSGRRALCAPLVRPRSRAFAYERPYAVELSLRSSSQRVILRRCGSRRVRILGRCAWSDCGEPVIAGGTVAWTEGRRAHVLVLRSGRRRTWRIPRDPAGGYGLVLSRRHLYVAADYHHTWRGTLPGR